MGQPIGVIGLAGHGKDTLADILVSEFGYTRLPFAAPLKEFVIAVCGFTSEELNDPLLKESYRCHAWPFRNRNEFRARIPDALARLVDINPIHMVRAADGVDTGEIDHRASGLTVSNLYRQVSDRIAIYIEPLIFHGMHAELCPTPRIIMQAMGTEVFRAVHVRFWTRIWKHRAEKHAGHVIAPDTRFQSEVDVVSGMGGRIVRVSAFVRRGHPNIDKLHASERAMLSFDADDEFTNDGTTKDFQGAVRAWAMGHFAAIAGPQPELRTGSLL